MAEDESFYLAAERRIEQFTFAVGLTVTVICATVWGVRVAAAFAVGAALSWVNFRWLKQGVGALTRLSIAQHDAPVVRVPKRVYAKFLGRYVLLLGAAYIILSRFRLPAGSLFAGLLAVAAAVIAEIIYELCRRV